MIVTNGGRLGGYGWYLWYLLKGKPAFLYNLVDPPRVRWEGKEPFAPGRHTVVFDFTYDGRDFGKGGTGVPRVNGKNVDAKKIPHAIPFLLPWDETFDVGMDPRTPEDDNDYQVPFSLPPRSSC